MVSQRCSGFFQICNRDFFPSFAKAQGHLRRHFARRLFFKVAEITLSGPSIPCLGSQQHGPLKLLAADTVSILARKYCTGKQALAVCLKTANAGRYITSASMTQRH